MNDISLELMASDMLIGKDQRGQDFVYMEMRFG